MDTIEKVPASDLIDEDKAAETRRKRIEFARYLERTRSAHDAEWWERLRADMKESGVYFGSERE